MVGLLTVGAAGCRPGKSVNPTPSATTAPGTTTSPRQTAGAFGTISSIAGSTLMLSTPAQGQVTVNIGTSTAIAKTVAGAVADLKTGQLLTVVGTADASGAIAAATISMRQPGQGTGGGTGFGNNAGGTPSTPGNGTAPGFPGGGGNFTSGSVTNISGSKLTLTTSQGTTTVTVGANTTILETVAGTISDLQAGQSVAVTGNRDASGNLNATSITIQFTRGSGPGASQTPAASAGPKIITTSLVPGTVAISYSQDLAASGGAPPYKWSIVGGALPGGLSVDSSGAAITGTPSVSGTFNFTVRVTDATGAMSAAKQSIVINPAGIGDTLWLPSGDVGVTYTHQLAGTISTGYPRDYLWVIPAGSLPAGLYLDSETAQILGTPAAVGTYSFTAELSGVTADSEYIVLTITINPKPSITTASLPDGQVGAPYSQILTSSGGSTPYIWSLAGGTLPDGLNLDDSTSAIFGTPTTAGVSNFSVTMTDAAGAVQTQSFSLKIGPAAAES